ncbi:integrase, catalytic region, zinc finger, CCHC-type containing protein [Tanacetum coccineum]
MKEIFEQMEAKVEQNVVDKQCANIERKNLLIENENLIADCLSNELLYSVMNDVNTVSIFSELHDAYTIEQARCLELKAEISKLKHNIQKDDHRLGHNLFSVGQFCDSDLEVAFRKHSRYVRNENGVDLLKGSRGSNLYTISVEDMMKSSPICLLSKASKNKSWLWHHRLNHLNSGTINDLARKDLVKGLPGCKLRKDHPL